MAGNMHTTHVVTQLPWVLIKARLVVSLVPTTPTDKLTVPSLALFNQPDGMAKWVEHPSPILGDQGIQTSPVRIPKQMT